MKINLCVLKRLAFGAVFAFKVTAFCEQAPNLGSYEPSAMQLFGLNGVCMESLTRLHDALRSALLRHDDAKFKGLLQIPGIEDMIGLPASSDLLTYAAGSGNLAACKDLIKHGARPNGGDVRLELGGGALEQAAIHGKTEVVQYLLSVGADAFAISPNTAAYAAYSNGHNDTADSILAFVDGKGLILTYLKWEEAVFKMEYRHSAPDPKLVKWLEVIKRRASPPNESE